MDPDSKKRLKFIVYALILFALLSFFISLVFSLFINLEPAGNVAVIPIKGVITVDGGSSFGSVTASSEEIVRTIQKVDRKQSIKAIVFDINSPGGSAVASQEIANAIKRTNKTTVAVIRELGASGGYWAASATDHIIASDMSITGSIGVIASYVEFAGLLQRYNMTYQQLIGGNRKDLGTPFRPLGEEERNILQTKINRIHDIFIKDVARNRNMDENKIRQLATGEFYLGIEAFENGLIDQLGDKETVKIYLQQKLNITRIEFAEYRRQTTLLDALTGVIAPQSFEIGRGIGFELKRTENNLKILT